MSSKRILTLIVIVIALVLMTIFIVRDSQERKILSLVEEYGGWVSMREPYKSNRLDYFNTPENWKETEQLIGQTSVKFTSQNKFVCEWEPVQSMNDLILVVTNCAELIGDQNEFRSAYILYKIGPKGNLESFFIPVGNDYSEFVLPFIKDPEDVEMFETRIEHLKMRLSSDNDIPPLVFERKGLLK